MKCSKLLSCRQFLREFHYSRLWFTYDDWKAFVYIPWLPYRWYYQLFHVFYRWFMALYFLGWLIGSGIQFADSGARWLIFLTNWAIVGFVLYLIIAALSVTTKYITVHVIEKNKADVNRDTDYLFKKAKGCCGSETNKLSWYQMIHWASFTIFGETALLVTILYWAVLYTPGSSIDGVNANTHLTNGIISVLDVLFCGLPISILHFIYPILFGSTYAVFSGVYWAANGTHPANGERYIYPILDYERIPVTASVIVVLVVLLAFPIIHLVFYSLHLIRFWAVYGIYGRSKVSCWGERAFSQDDDKMEMEDKKDEV